MQTESSVKNEHTSGKKTQMEAKRRANDAALPSIYMYAAGQTELPVPAFDEQHDGAVGAASSCGTDLD